MPDPNKILEKLAGLLENSDSESTFYNALVQFFQCIPNELKQEILDKGIACLEPLLLGAKSLAAFKELSSEQAMLSALKLFVPFWLCAENATMTAESIATLNSCVNLFDAMSKEDWTNWGDISIKIILAIYIMLFPLVLTTCFMINPDGFPGYRFVSTAVSNTLNYLPFFRSSATPATAPTVPATAPTVPATAPAIPATALGGATLAPAPTTPSLSPTIPS